MDKDFCARWTLRDSTMANLCKRQAFRDNCFSYTRELRLLMNIFYINRNTVDTGRTSIMHLNWPWIGVPPHPYHLPSTLQCGVDGVGGSAGGGLLGRRMDGQMICSEQFVYLVMDVRSFVFDQHSGKAERKITGERGGKGGRKG